MWFLKKKFDFYAMLHAQAEKTEEGMLALTEYVKNPSPENGDRVVILEKEADELRRVLVEALNQSFVTPIDREDIYALSRAIDDMVDYAKSTVEEMLLFEIKPNGYLQRISEALHQSSRDIAFAVKLLKSSPQASSEHVIRAKKAENFVEHRYREALAELFKNPNVVEILKLREIYRHLSNAADRGDEAANIIGDILVKTT